MTTNKWNQDRIGQLSTHNIFYQTVVAVTQFIQKYTSVASQNNTRQCKVKLFHHHHHLFAQYAEMNSKTCNVPDRKANSFSSDNCP